MMTKPGEMKDISPEFTHAIRALRKLPDRYRLMAAYAALFWSEERLDAAERDSRKLDATNPPGRLQ
jgi:hypothetical protein